MNFMVKDSRIQQRRRKNDPIPLIIKFFLFICDQMFFYTFSS